MKLPKTYGFLKKDLDIIEEALHRAIQADHEVLNEAVTALLNAGGKRIRPVFVVLAGQLGDFNAEKVKKVAVSLELIHMATLVHDDVIDEAELRRGKPTVKTKYGNRVAMYTGDYILARALEEITSIEDKAVHRILSKTLVEVSIGEIEQIRDKYNWNQSLKDYLRRIKRKTALLIATSCKLGAVVSGMSERDSNKLYQYGYNIGMSYQIIDDILDFTSNEKVLGKPAGNDLLQGNITLPILYAMENADFKKSLQDRFQSPELITKAEMKQFIQHLEHTDAINRSYQLSNQYLAKALKTLEGIPNHRAKRTLEDIAKFIGKRRS
ncbi:heptaprenyl diphosphate synthase component II [Oceanobacillus piezotolerans]|uniref:Heptaprenyl diphosphate synthase component 2 n=1 Tax=Oceanobacillus piezotolerans TaxID=2448030 RepID=A0A498DTL4_9BACI|nr:heptaprenyl diphosphate synthase component II [Oceanobacillus piezotolerans]RLL48207.1 heptaprenyl diphosphate synthase component II [Oceanobacillus piezotolerans]